MLRLLNFITSFLCAIQIVIQIDKEKYFSKWVPQPWRRNWDPYIMWIPWMDDITTTSKTQQMRVYPLHSVPSTLQYNMHQIPKLKCFSSRLAVVFVLWCFGLFYVFNHCYLMKIFEWWQVSAYWQVTQNGRDALCMAGVQWCMMKCQ